MTGTRKYVQSPLLKRLYGRLCFFGTSDRRRFGHTLGGLKSKKGAPLMPRNSLVLALVLVVTSIGLGGCFVGKGKAPVTPVVITKG